MASHYGASSKAQSASHTSWLHTIHTSILSNTHLVCRLWDKTPVHAITTGHMPLLTSKAHFGRYALCTSFDFAHSHTSKHDILPTSCMLGIHPVTCPGLRLGTHMKHTLYIHTVHTRHTLEHTFYTTHMHTHTWAIHLVNNMHALQAHIFAHAVHHRHTSQSEMHKNHGCYAFLMTHTHTHTYTHTTWNEHLYTPYTFATNCTRHAHLRTTHTEPFFTLTVNQCLAHTTHWAFFHTEEWTNALHTPCTPAEIVL